MAPWLIRGFLFFGMSGFSPLGTYAAAGPHPPATEPTTTSAPVEPLRLWGVMRLRESFNPTQDQDVPIRFQLNKPAKVTVSIYGPNRELIRHVVDQQVFPAGRDTVLWDGRDGEGPIVPDEAYTFMVVATADEESQVWDPRLTSGGERVIAGDLRTHDVHRFSYELPKPCRVLVRAAVEDGPLVRTLVNWEPRPTGFCLEHWDGMDADGLRDISEIPGLRIAVAAMALPEQVVLAVGNTTSAYRDYYREKGRQRPHRSSPQRARETETVLSPHWPIPPHLNRDPRIKMTLEGAGVSAAPVTSAPTASAPVTTQPATSSTQPAAGPESTPVAGDTVLVHVDIPDATEREFMNEQKFELIIYVDDRRVVEVEQGHVPFTYPWDVRALTPGRHLLTVNVSSFRNHVGTVSRLIDLRR